MTTALNCVLKSQKLHPGDITFSLDCEYGANKKMLSHLCQESGAVSQVERVQFPIQSKQQILDLFKTKLKPETKLILFDHIPSNTPFIMPVKVRAPLIPTSPLPPCQRSHFGFLFVMDYVHYFFQLHARDIYNMEHGDDKHFAHPLS